MDQLVIREVRARAVIAPLQRPIRTASGSIEASPLVLLDVATDQGITGRAYLFAYTPVVLRSLLALAQQLAPLLHGQPVVPLARQEQLERQFRLLGLQGLLGMMISGLDMAFWDALGQAAGRPVAALLGGEPRPVRAYDSWGLVDPAKDAAALARSVERGFRGVEESKSVPIVTARVSTRGGRESAQSKRYPAGVIALRVRHVQVAVQGGCRRTAPSSAWA